MRGDGMSSSAPPAKCTSETDTRQYEEGSSSGRTQSVRPECSLRKTSPVTHPNCPRNRTRDPTGKRRSRGKGMMFAVVVMAGEPSAGAGSFRKGNTRGAIGKSPRALDGVTFSEDTSNMTPVLLQAMARRARDQRSWSSSCGFSIGPFAAALGQLLASFVF